MLNFLPSRDASIVVVSGLINADINTLFNHLLDITEGNVRLSTSKAL